MSTISVTLDTSALPADDLRAGLEAQGFSFATVSVTERESRGTTFAATLKYLGTVPETGVWDESEWDAAVWGGPANAECFERVLQLISANSFPPPNQRERLSPGERNQLRDAMIFCAHVREHRDIFVTNDLRAFVNHGRREALETAFSTRVMTRAEFRAAFCPGSAAV